MIVRPTRGGRRVVFVSLDDGTGPVSNVVFHDIQEQIGSGIFQTHYMLIRGKTRHSGARGATLADVTPLRRRTANTA